jgi:cellulose synthase/poly-beta-1,6-N-acetylglucosamine synthase-like glycosyltransferase
MPTVVIDNELNKIPAELTVSEHYDTALVLIRLNGKPVGQVLLPVSNGKIDCHSGIRTFLTENPQWDFWENWLKKYLDHEERPEMTELPKATIAVCTRNRPNDLKVCLDGLVSLPDDGQEILVVDNCPANNDTKNMSGSYPGVRYVREEKRGLNNARNRALLEAKNEIVAFIDDDATPDTNWLRSMLRNFDTPLVMGVTGLTLPLELETEAQEMFERLTPFSRGFMRVVYDSAKIDPVDCGRLGSGVNMAFRKKVLECVGRFDKSLETGSPGRSAGDIDFFSRILAAGYRIVYEPSALNWHRHREDWMDLRRQLYDYGVGIFAYYTRSLLFEHSLSTPRVALQWINAQLQQLARSMLRQPPRIPLDLLVTRLVGCAVGPWAYLYSRWRQASNEKLS